MAKFGKSAEAPASQDIPSANVPAPLNQLPSGTVSQEQFQKVLDQMAQMQEMMLETGDQNKIRAFNRRVSRPQNYCFNLGLWPVEGKDRFAAIVSSKLIKNSVFGAKNASQELELELADVECPAGETPVTTAKTSLEDFNRKLDRTDKIECKSLSTVDGQALGEFEDENGSKKLAIPTRETVIDHYEGKNLSVKVQAPCKATIPYKGKDLTVDLKFLNM